MSKLFEVLYNIGVPISFMVISGFVGLFIGERKWSKYVQGIIMGLASVIVILHPLYLTEGVILDARSIILSICALVYGPISAVIAALMAIITRVSQGGAGAPAGVGVITASVVIGLVFRHYRANGRLRHDILYALGIIVHLVMLLLLLTIPDGIGKQTVKNIGLAVIIFYPLATVIFGMIFDLFRERSEHEKVLSEKNNELDVLNTSLSKSLESLRRNEVKLKTQYEIIERRERNFRTLFENSNDINLILDEKIILDCNETAVSFFGLSSKKEMIGKKIWEISPLLDRDLSKVESLLMKTIYRSKVAKDSRFEWVHYSNDGSSSHLEMMLAPVFYNGLEVTLAAARDVSKQKATEKRLEYLSFHDQLTDVYNRRFYEEELKRIDVRRNLPLSIVLGDVNRLKMINDSFGHQSGDTLLIKAAAILKKACREDDIIARIGGDEFAILLPKTSTEDALNIVNRIEKFSLEETVNNLEISITFGIATKNEEDEDIDIAFRKAEDELYQKKMSESSIIKGKTVDTIISALHEKSILEEEHGNRVSYYCGLVAEKIGYSPEKIKEIMKLGHVHDIGKIVIPAELLSRDGNVEGEEWTILKKHAEIGYRILSSSNEYYTIANAVLHHHERWDGSGYPKGISGDDIPRNARILSICDAYDSMVNRRYYKTRISKDDAISELRCCSGTQCELVEIFIDVLKIS